MASLAPMYSCGLFRRTRQREQVACLCETKPAESDQPNIPHANLPTLVARPLALAVPCLALSSHLLILARARNNDMTDSRPEY
eukprot:2946135-Pleurochrysis_carterae.AAC.3